ncbi:MAG: hypothetical protein WD688_12955 [Candidatus Binatia bacterium]
MEEVAKAETTSKTLLFRLADLQCRLRSLAAIKRSITAVRAVIEQESNADFNVSTLEKINRPIHLQAIVQASKLIKFPEIHRFSQQPAQEIAPHTAGNSQISPTAKTFSEPAQETVQASTPTALVSVGADFDQQLLDDLIKSYGEFVSSPELRPTVKPQTKPEIVVAGTVKNFSETPPSRDVIDSTNRHLPTLKKEGEIDRQLKKIIKDYGEYDIYSRQSPINLKFGVIGAFLLLGAVFSGFYFLSSPTAIESSNHPAIIQPTTMPSSSESVAADKNNRGRNAAPGNRESK